ncbi:MAG TPA: hypothetical protein PLS81_01650 [Deltaproteobacteria bacterium]|nr:hypothetical protein [Deltaproteobacteria bacterium]HOM28146.1 hypothetical protein [Deltaproteobacteria bacterium]HPP79286.1 hypothetical protein [Deltaproteobacteria bacterium]
MAGEKARKADLDKEGIVLGDTSKAELDKEGITLAQEVDQDGAVGDEPGTPQAEGKSEGGQEKVLGRGFFARYRLAVACGGAGALLAVVVAAAALIMSSSPEPVSPQTHKAVHRKAQDGIVLDPFMVFYETHEDNRPGILVAQVSLKVDPSVVPTVMGNLYDIRNIIYRRLAGAASAYSQTEIALMLSDDLLDYPIKEVAFLQYQAR